MGSTPIRGCLFTLGGWIGKHLQIFIAIATNMLLFELTRVAIY